MVIKICKICGKEFDGRYNAKFCSSQCRKINKKEYYKKWCEQNKERQREYRQKYFSSDKGKTAQKKYFSSDKGKEKNKKNFKKYYQKNKEKILAKQKEDNIRIINELQQSILENDILTHDELEQGLKKIGRAYYKRELEVIKYNQDYSQSYYKDFIIAIRTRAGGYCELTNKKVNNGAAHHLYSFSNYIELGADPNNGIYLDEEIHKQFHSDRGYNCTADDFIDFCNKNEYKVSQLVLDLKETEVK